MARLIQLASPVEPPVALIGGVPTIGAELPWPVCKSCKGHMQFIAQMPLRVLGIPAFADSAEFLLVFQCQNDPGMCDEWDPDAGGNKVIIAPSGGPMAVPPTGVTRADLYSPAILADYDETVRDESDDDNYWAAYTGKEPQILGKAGGSPIWIQSDETPTCTCGVPMKFAFQLEERGGKSNFGDGGAAYIFICPACRQQARFLFQCG